MSSSILPCDIVLPIMHTGSGRGHLSSAVARQNAAPARRAAQPARSAAPACCIMAVYVKPMPIIVRPALFRGTDLARLETFGAPGTGASKPCSHSFQSQRVNPTLDTPTGVNCFTRTAKEAVLVVRGAHGKPCWGVTARRRR